MSKIILASAVWCSNCKPAKMALDTANIDYDVFDVDSEDAEANMPEGLRGIPALILEGKVVAQGQLGIVNWINDNKEGYQKES